jgi:hypothetical protein
MTWLQGNICPKAVASVGLGLDYRYLPLLTGVSYSGDLPQNTPPEMVLKKSVAMGFGCVAIEANNQNLRFFESLQAFDEKYRNAEIVIFMIATEGSS